MKTHRNLPFFVPHAGCPNCCVFCSQTKITGQSKEKDLNTEISELRNLLENCGTGFDESQIGFFGGSFTAIRSERMTTLLSVANEYIKKGVASSIRISTRPDKISQEILDVLKNYGVTNIEIGVQSTDDSVLEVCERGHTAENSFSAAKLIVENGFVLGGQMMIGLPNATIESEVQTALDIVKMGAKEARIYPTVVFENTKLYQMALDGKYIPLSVDEAARRSAKCYKIFLDAGVKVLRIGLHASENLSKAPMGANHQSIGELVKGFVYADIIAESVGNAQGKIITVEIKKEDISMLSGHKSIALDRIKSKTGALRVELIASDLPRFCPVSKIRSV